MAAARLSLAPSTRAASALGWPLPEQHANVTAHGDRDPPSTSAGEGTGAALLRQDKGVAHAGGKTLGHSGSAEQAFQGPEGDAAASGKAAPHAEPCAPNCRSTQSMHLSVSPYPDRTALSERGFLPASSTGQATLHACPRFQDSDASKSLSNDARQVHELQENVQAAASPGAWHGLDQSKACAAQRAHRVDISRAWGPHIPVQEVSIQSDVCSVVSFCHYLLVI